MAETVRLLSAKGRAQLIEVFYFYDGETAIKAGVVEIPLDRPEWVQRAYIMGYRQDPVTEAVLTLDEALAGGRAVKSTESAGEDIEGSNAGGLPAGDDGLRESEPESSNSVSSEGLDGGVGDGPTVRASGNKAGNRAVRPATGRPDGAASRNKSI